MSSLQFRSFQNINDHPLYKLITSNNITPENIELRTSSMFGIRKKGTKILTDKIKIYHIVFAIIYTYLKRNSLKRQELEALRHESRNLFAEKGRLAEQKDRASVRKLTRTKKELKVLQERMKVAMNSPPLEQTDLLSELMKETNLEENKHKEYLQNIHDVLNAVGDDNTFRVDNGIYSYMENVNKGIDRRKKEDFKKNIGMISQITQIRREIINKISQLPLIHEEHSKEHVEEHGGKGARKKRRRKTKKRNARRSQRKSKKGKRKRKLRR